MDNALEVVCEVPNDTWYLKYARKKDGIPNHSFG